MLRAKALNDEHKKPMTLWQPLTFGGVAAFARASLARLFVTELIFASLAAASIVTSARLAVSPPVKEIIRQLPDSGAILNGHLEWPADAAMISAESHVVTIRIDPTGEAEAGQEADLLLVLGPASLSISSQFSSLIGEMELPYPTDRLIPLNRTELQPWWGAWEPPILAGIGVCTALGLMATWSVLAVLYSLPLWFTAYLADRDVNWRGCWRAASAAMLPGALVMGGAVLLYGLRQLPLPGLMLAAALHVVIGWIYLIAAPFKFPKKQVSTAAGENPFTGLKADTAGDGPKRAANPFAPTSDEVKREPPNPA